jgi:hypothetical protein
VRDHPTEEEKRMGVSSPWKGIGDDDSSKCGRSSGGSATRVDERLRGKKGGGVCSRGW